MLLLIAIRPDIPNSKKILYTNRLESRFIDGIKFSNGGSHKTWSVILSQCLLISDYLEGHGVLCMF